MSLGISLSLGSALGVSPYDALLVGLSVQAGLTVGSWEVILAFIMILMLLLRQKTGMSILTARTAIYVLFLAMAALFQGPIGLGTLATVFLGGPLLNLFMPWIGVRLKLYSETGKAG